MSERQECRDAPTDESSVDNKRTDGNLEPVYNGVIASCVAPLIAPILRLLAGKWRSLILSNSPLYVPVSMGRHINLIIFFTIV